MRYILFVLIILNFSMGYSQATKKEFLNSEWWMLHGYACMNLSYLKLDKGSFLLCIQKPRENLKFKGTTFFNSDTIVIRIDNSTEDLNGFLIKENKLIVLPDLIKNIADRGFDIPANTLINNESHLSHLEKKKRKIIRKKIKSCMSSNRCK